MGKREEFIKIIKELEDEELRRKIAELTRELVGWRTVVRIEGKTNPAKIRALRRDIARIKTILREREIQKRSAQKN